MTQPPHGGRVGALGRRALALLLVALVACGQEATAPSPPPVQTPNAQTPDMTEVLARTTMPQADLFALTRRLRGKDGTPGPWQPVRTDVPDRQVGDRDTFFYYDHAAKRHLQMTAVIRLKTARAYWYVQEGLPADPARLQQTALEFEGRIYPTDRRAYGEEWSPGIDNDPRITILMGRVPRIAGSFSEADEYPRWVHPFSNEREMVVINLEAVPPGTPQLLSTLAHEFAHMIQFNTRKRAVVWFNEGQAQLAEQLNGFSLGAFATQFFRSPDTQLNDWADDPGTAGPYYGHAFLLLDYLAERFGGSDIIRELMASGVDTTLDVDAAVRRRGSTFEDLYLDFAATNGLLERSDAPAPYRYAQVRLPERSRVAREPAPEPGASRKATVHDFATRYYELPAGRFTLDFRGATQARLLPTDPHSGRYVWWSNRADKIDTTLTRRVDLRATRSATLRFWAWYEIEDGWDYAYVAASDDGGKTWKTLPGTLTTNEDPNGSNLGNGITGRSGRDSSTWVEERMDLGTYAGKEILLRFEYVTDLALNKGGFAIDDLSIPEIGWRDDAESPGDWEAAGFVRSTNVVGRGFGLQLLRLSGAPAVQRILVDQSGAARVDVDVQERGAVLLAVTSFAFQTTEPATFELRLDRRP